MSHLTDAAKPTPTIKDARNSFYLFFAGRSAVRGEFASRIQPMIQQFLTTGLQIQIFSLQVTVPFMGSSPAAYNP